jgi:hypothetical protein
MDHLSKQLLVLSEKIKTLLFSYSEILKENDFLKNRISLLENDLSSLKHSLEEKKEMLNSKDEDSIFVSILIDELLEEFSHYNYKVNDSVLIKDPTNSSILSFDLKKNSNNDELGGLL